MLDLNKSGSKGSKKNLLKALSNPNVEMRKLKPSRKKLSISKQINKMNASSTSLLEQIDSELTKEEQEIRER
jgi:hypothetical protein